jgi:hypothetical protein
MNQIIKVNDHDVSVIEWNNERVITTAQLADVYEANEQQVQQNFNNHQDNFTEGKHYILLKGDELKSFKRYFDNIEVDTGVSKFASQLYLWTRRGASRHCKILDTEKAWEQFDTMEESYFNPKASEHKCIEDVLIESLQEMKSMRERLNTQDNKIGTVETKLDGIKEIVAMNSIDWREETGNLIRKMSVEQGGGQAFSQIRTESYEQLEKRMGANLKTRLTFKRGRMADEGVCKSKRDKLSYLDIIAEDKKLIEGYVAIVKEMAIKYGVV